MRKRWRRGLNAVLATLVVPAFAEGQSLLELWRLADGYRVLLAGVYAAWVLVLAIL